MKIKDWKITFRTDSVNQTIAEKGNKKVILAGGIIKSRTILKCLLEEVEEFEIYAEN